MVEKVNAAHPDKVADIIAGALVDLAYAKDENPKIAVEVLIGHGICHIIAETSVKFKKSEVKQIVKRIAGNVKVDFKQVAQDVHLASNQKDKIRCGDNGIFKGVPLTKEQNKLSKIARDIYEKYPTDGKYILDGNNLIICQSNAKTSELRKLYPNAIINPLGEWTGGTNADCGCCLNEDTLIYTINGLKPIKEIQIGDTVYTEKGKANVIDFINNGVKPTRIIKDEFGGEIEATNNHPFRVYDGEKIVWKLCENLKEGDVLLRKNISHIVDSQKMKKSKYITFPIYSDSGTHEKVCDKKIKIDTDFAYLIGWLIGDGNNTADDRIAFYFGNEVEKQHLKTLLEKVFGKDMVKYYDYQSDRFYILSKGLVAALLENGMSQSIAYNKQVPKFILESNDGIKGAFISGLFDADGCVRCETSEGRIAEHISINLVTTSPVLAQQVKILLHSMNIESTISKRAKQDNVVIKGKKVAETHDVYNVNIRGVYSCKRFTQYCGFRLENKRTRCDKHLFNRRVYNNNTYYLFSAISDLLNLNTTKKNKYFPRHTSNQHREGFKESTVDYILDMYAEYKETDIYKHIKNIYDNFQMVKIKNITTGSSQTYDITLDDDTHSFVANGYVVHNTNRKLGSDMADSVTGGGLHGKDLSKADVSVNIYAFLKAQETGKPVKLCCAIGDESIDGRPYEEVVEIARNYIKSVGGFEAFAEWGLY